MKIWASRWNFVFLQILNRWAVKHLFAKKNSEKFIINPLKSLFFVSRHNFARKKWSTEHVHWHPSRAICYLCTCPNADWLSIIGFLVGGGVIQQTIKYSFIFYGFILTPKLQLLRPPALRSFKDFVSKFSVQIDGWTTPNTVWGIPRLSSETAFIALFLSKLNMRWEFRIWCVTIPSIRNISEIPHTYWSAFMCD